jgi:CheY-like chemotaxis protein
MARLRPRLLIVDDDDEVRQLLAAFLFESGYDVDSAAGGEEALDKLRGDGPLPALVLLDVMMPGLDGLDVLRVMQSTERLKLVPVLLMTASYLPILPAGTRHISKPLDIVKLLSVIQECCA